MILSAVGGLLTTPVGPVGHPLHIPDGFLSLAISLIFWVLTLVLITVAARRAGDTLGERQIPLVGVLAAAIFAAQMLNFPVAGGTSGHMLGGALAAIVLGPWAGILAMSAVVGVQALMFQDGGLVVLGANIFNMGIATAIVGYGLYRPVAGRGPRLRLGAAAAAAWLSTMAAALLTSLQIWLSGNADATLLFPAMIGVHALIGVGEALLTVAALGFIATARPDVISAGTVRAQAGRGWAPAGLLAALAVVLLAPFASASPDGLERVAGELGLLESAQAAPFELLPDYTIPLLGNGALSTLAAGTVGVLVVALLLRIALPALRRRAEPEIERGG